ncbi:MAG: DUF4139 domain-containing protein [Pseudomonadota bacterium]
MHRLLLSALLLAPPAFAADFTPESTLTSATLYPIGATLTRSAAVDLPAGRHRVILDDLPLELAPESLRVEGVGTTAFTILSVDHRIDRLPPDDPEISPERARLEAEIELLREQLIENDVAIRSETAWIEAAERRIDLVDALIRKQGLGEQSALAVADWPTAFASIRAEAEAAIAARLAAEVSRERIQRSGDETREEIERLEAELDALELPPRPRSIATITLQADAATIAELAVSYRSDRAGWAPVYDLRLTRGEDDLLNLTRLARVHQETGENWEGVDLTLSTARPSANVAPPEVEERVLRPFVIGQARGASLTSLEARPEPMILPEADLSEPAPAPPPARAVAAQATFETRGQTVIYRITEPADVAGDGTVRQLTIDVREAEVDLVAHTAPAFDSAAYLVGEWQNTLGGPLLPGQAALFRDGTFVGETDLPFVAAGEIAELPFGREDGLLIERATLTREDGDFGLIGTSYRRVERFRITAENLSRRTVPLIVTDRAPVSENEDIRVTLSATPSPTDTDADGRRGVHRWRVDMMPGSVELIDFGYTITWPEGITLPLD